MAWPTKTDFVDGDVLTAAQVNNIGTNLNVFNPTSATNGQVWTANGSGSGSYQTISPGSTLVAPSTIANTGGGSSASINASGSVTFSACATVSLNGIFTSTYDNYLVLWKGTTSTSGVDVQVKLRLSGTDSSASYNFQRLDASGTTVSAARFTNQTTGMRAGISDTNISGFAMYFFGPGIAARTVARSISAGANSGGYLEDFVSTHDVATAYDGATFYVSSGTVSGDLYVYGLRK